MLGCGLEVGDKVILDVSDDAISWGYKVGVNGEVLDVLGFSEIAYGRINNLGHRPGIYENDCWIKVNPKTGNSFTISSCYLKPFDEVKYEKLCEENYGKRNFIRPLPTTYFYELDEVKTPMGCGYINNIRYLEINRYYDNGVEMSPYTIQFKNGGSSWFKEKDLTLIERGNVWKYYMDEPLSFNDIEDEVKFHKLMGWYDEVRNPRTSFYYWNFNEIANGIKNNVIDALYVSDFIGITSNQCIKFHDEFLGRKIAKKTLEGFKNV